MTRPPAPLSSALTTDRRGLLKLAGVAGVLHVLPACAGRSSPLFLSEPERTSLAHLADLVIPPDDAPGGAALGAVLYIDRLLSGDGLVFGSGPFSGRTPFPDARGLPTSLYPEDRFAVAEPLERVQAQALLRLLDGVSASDPSRDPAVPPFPGLRALFRTGLAGVTATTTLEDLESDFVDALVELVSEGAFAAPEYGGNTDLKGWQMVGYEGDRMPLGFSTFDEVAGAYREDKNAPVSTKDPHRDPAPIDADVESFLGTAIAVLGGRDTKA